MNVYTVCTYIDYDKPFLIKKNK